MSNRKNLWHGLAQEPCGDSGYVRRRVAVPSMNAFLALAMPENRPALLVEASAEALPAGSLGPETEGFRLTIAPLKAGPHGRVLLALELTDLRYADLFSFWVDDILSHIEVASTEKQGLCVFLERIRQWQRFFQHHGIEGLTAFEQQGLFGELWFLQNMLLPLHPAGAVRSWCGPDGANQDFYLPQSAIEIKTTSANPHEKVTISNVLQLDETGLSALYMVHLSLSPRRGTGESLPSLVAALRLQLEALAPLTIGTFDELLLKAGYLEAHASMYEATGYSIRNVRFYQIRNGFPRLLMQNLPEGVGDLRYSIAIAACSKFEVPEQDFKEFLAGS